MNKKISILVIVTFLAGAVAVDNTVKAKEEKPPKVKCRECIEENYKRKMPPLKDSWGR